MVEINQALVTPTGASASQTLAGLSAITLKKIPGPTGGIFGTSITDQNSRLIRPPASSPSSAWFNDGYATWLRILSGQSFNISPEYDFGVSGNTLSDMLARIDPVLAAPLDFCIVEGGANNSLDTTFAFESARDTWLQIVGRLYAAGIYPICIPILPTGGTGRTTAQLLGQQRFNNFIREYAYGSGKALVCDPMVYMLDQTSANNNPIAGMLKADNLHPAVPGAFAIAKALWDILAPIYPPRPTVLVSNLDYYDATNNPSGSLVRSSTTNRSLLAGTGGTQTANAGLTYAGTGLAAGWTFVRGTATSTCTVTLDKENPRTDGRASGERQRVRIAAASGGGADEIYNLRFSPAFADFAPGDWVYGECSIEMAAAPARIMTVEMYLLEFRPSNSQTAIDLGFNSPVAGFLPAETWKGVLRTPPIQIQPDSTAFQANIRARVDASAGAASCDFYIGDFAVRKLAA